MPNLKIETEKNKYGHRFAICPFCEKELIVRNVYRHFASEARNEALEKALGNIELTPHLVFYKESTIVMRTEKREWIKDSIQLVEKP